MVISELRELIEEKTGALLSVAGGCLSIQIVLNTLPNLHKFTIQGGLPAWVGIILPTGILGYIGLTMPFVVLLGLYYRLSSEAPRIAFAGGTLMALTPVLFVDGLLTALVWPDLDLQYLLWLSPLPYVVGVGLFALAFLGRVGPIRFVGIPMLVFSGTWVLTFVVGLVNGGLPAELPFVELLAVSLITMGLLLNVGSTTPNSRTPTGR